jgi:hypothetical protein
LRFVRIKGSLPKPTNFSKIGKFILMALMLALSVKQPWLFLIKSGAKTIETRTWKTDYRGDILLCASLSPAKDMSDMIRIIVEDPSFDGFHYGQAQCIVELNDIQPMTEAHEIDALCLVYSGAY